MELVIESSIQWRVIQVVSFKLINDSDIIMIILNMQVTMLIGLV